MSKLPAPALLLLVANLIFLHLLKSGFFRFLSVKQPAVIRAEATKLKYSTELTFYFNSGLFLEIEI